MPALRIPSSTYRLQFNKDFTLDDARTLVPYLHDLGVTDLYASPLLQARQGSTFGYDVVDPTRVNQELGGEDALAGLTNALRRRDMGLLLDIVPNHMAAIADNQWWSDVLRHGPNSPYARFFDINWLPNRPGMAGKVLLPVLGSPYGEVLENGELVLNLEKDGFWVHYHENRVPVRPDWYRYILGFGNAGSNGQPDFANLPVQLMEIAAELDNPTPGNDTGRSSTFRKITRRLWQLYHTDSELRNFINKAIKKINGVKGKPGSFEHLDKLLAGQHYRLAFWRTANHEINYRRFFSTNELVALRVEDEHVFEATHRLVLRLCRDGMVTGLRIDHIDGLHNPEVYLNRLQEHLASAIKPPGFYIVVEKILGQAEELPAGWPVYGTTGYDFLDLVNGLFVHNEGLSQLNSIYHRHGSAGESFKELVYKLKKRALMKLFGSEINNLTEFLGRLAEQDRQGCDLTLDQLKRALVELIACFPIYRTYTNEFTVTVRDELYIEKSITLASRLNPDAKRALGFLRRVLLLQFNPYQPREQRQDWLHFVMRWQQFTGPVAAKGVEDAAMYVYNRLVSLNEVGDEPDAPPESITVFHHSNLVRLQRLPHSMNATSTHDTKRSEDVRMRINVLSEIPSLWAGRLEHWCKWNNQHKPTWNGRPVPGGNMEQFIYQTLIGAWPLQEEETPGFKVRLEDYLIKAAREAGMSTGWLQQDHAYEQALLHFTAAILEPGEDNLFWQDFTRFQPVIAYYGAINSLGQTLLKITSPGVPDFYQGTELWNFSLVDPDNRRPVNFEKRIAILTQIKEQEASGRAALTVLSRNLLESWQDGRVKLFLIYRALQYRQNHPELFAGGEYIPVKAAGPGAGHICAFARRTGESWILVAVPRLLALYRTGCGNQVGPEKQAAKLPPLNPPLGEKIWGANSLLLPREAPGLWQNILTGENLTAAPASPDASVLPGSWTLPLAAVWQNFPVALLAGT